MADIAITAANVLSSSSAVIRKEYNFGYASATAGQLVYLDSSNLWQRVDSNAGATGNGVSDLKGYTLNGGGIGQPAVVCTSDPSLTVGGTLVNGTTYYSSTTAGGIAPDVPTTGAYPTVLGVAKSTSVLNFSPLSSGVVI